MTSAYLDAAYLAQCYVENLDSEKVRELMRSVETVFSSALSLAEVSCAIHRAFREGAIEKDPADDLRRAFLADVSTGIVRLIPISETILRLAERTVAKLPSTVYLRAGDTIHLATAQQEGFAEVWTNDRHMLRAASHFGIAGSSV